MILNEMNLAGNVGRDAEVKMSNAGRRIVKFSVGHTQKGFGDKPDHTTWFNVTAIETERPGSKYLVDDAARVKKGSNVYISGPLSLREYKGKDGSDKTSLDLLANRIAIIEKAPKPGVSIPDYDIGDVPF